MVMDDLRNEISLIIKMIQCNVIDCVAYSIALTIRAGDIQG